MAVFEARGLEEADRRQVPRRERGVEIIDVVLMVRRIRRRCVWDQAVSDRRVELGRAWIEFRVDA